MKGQIAGKGLRRLDQLHPAVETACMAQGHQCTHSRVDTPAIHELGDLSDLSKPESHSLALVDDSTSIKVCRARMFFKPASRPCRLRALQTRDILGLSKIGSCAD